MTHLTSFSIFLQEDTMKRSLCEALQNKLLSVQSPLRVRAELFLKYLSVILLTMIAVYQTFLGF